MRRRLAAIIGSLIFGMAIWVAVPAQALPSGNHTSRLMVDTDTPVYAGYDSTLKAYHFVVNGRWRAVCGTSRFCWPGVAGQTGQIGGKDAVGIHFAGPMQIKKQRIRSWGYCSSTAKQDNTSTHVSGGFFDYHAGVSDTIYEAGRKWGGIAGSGSNGSCFSSVLPQATSQGGGAWVTQWFDLRAQRYTYDVWVNPTPTSGSCFTSMTVKGAYTHTWATQSPAFSLGYPWGVGIGVAEGSGDFTAYQDGDGYSDADLRVGQMCRH